MHLGLSHPHHPHGGAVDIFLAAPRPCPLPVCIPLSWPHLPERVLKHDARQGESRTGKMIIFIASPNLLLALRLVIVKVCGLLFRGPSLRTWLLWPNQQFQSQERDPRKRPPSPLRRWSFKNWITWGPGRPYFLVIPRKLTTYFYYYLRVQNMWLFHNGGRTKGALEGLSVLLSFRNIIRRLICVILPPSPRTE